MGLLSSDAPVAGPTEEEKKALAAKDAPKASDGFNPSASNAATIQNIAKARQGLARQRDVAQQGVKAVGEAEQSALTGLRAQSGRAFAQDQSRGGGGSLARMRQSALARGAAEGEMHGDFAGRKQAAEMAAARGETEFATESEKLNQAEVARVGEGAKTYQDVNRKYQELVKNNTFITDADRRAAMKTIGQMYVNEPNEAVRKEVRRALADIESGTIEGEASLDVGTWF